MLKSFSKKYSTLTLPAGLCGLPSRNSPYDYLVVAAGASHAYFGHDEWEPLAPGLKTIEDAMEIRSRVLMAFEVGRAAGLLSPRQDPAKLCHCWSRPDRR